jgi:hypothetical protein
MKQAVQPFRRFRFGVFEVDLRTGELTKLGKRVRLQEQPLQLLAMLLEKPGLPPRWGRFFGPGLLLVTLF